MNKLQKKLLCYLYRSDYKIQDIYNKFNIEYQEFVTLVYDLEDYINIKQMDNYNNSILWLSPKGEEVVENYKSDRLQLIINYTFHVITLAIALAALFVK